MSTNIYLKLCEIFEIEPNNTIPNSVFNEIHEDSIRTWGGIPGTTMPEELKKQISLTLKNRTFSEETKLKIKEARKLQVFSEETKRKMSESQKKTKKSKETKLKMSLAKKEKKQTEEHIKNKAMSKTKKVKIDNTIYENAKEASIALNVHKVTIYKMIKNGRGKYL